MAEQYDYFVLNIKTVGNEIPKEFFIEIENHDFLMKKVNASEHQFLFKNLEKNQDFTINGGGYKSKKYILNVLPRSNIKSVKTIITPPKYTKKEITEINSIEDIIAPKGSYIKWQINFENTDNVLLFLDEKKSLSSSNTQFKYSQQFLASKKAQFIHNNNFGLGDTLDFNIKIHEDESPLINARQFKDSVNGIFVLEGKISDDYGISELTFNYQIKKEGNSVIQSERLKTSSDIEQLFFYDFSTSKLQLDPGEEVVYFFEVWDNDKINGRKKTKSQNFSFTEKTEKENILEKDLLNNQIENSLNNSISKAQKLKEKIEKLNKDLLEKKDLGWDEKQKTKEILNKQKQIINEINLNRKAHESQQKKSSKISPENQEKAKQLKELMDNVIDEELKNLINELEKLISKDEKEKLKELLDKLDTKNNDL